MLLLSLFGRLVRRVLLLWALVTGGYTIATAVPLALADPEPLTATAAEVTNFITTHHTSAGALRFPGFVPGQVYLSHDTTYLFLSRELKVAPSTAWPECNKPRTPYHVFIVDRSETEKTDGYQLLTEVAIIRDPELRIFGGGAVAFAGKALPPISILAQDKIAARTGTLTLAFTLKNSEAATPNMPVAQHTFTLSDCDLGYHVGIMLGVNASFLSTPTNIATSQLPGSTNYTLVADDPTTHQSLTVMAMFYPTPRRYGYEYKELSFFQKFNVSVGSQVGPALLSDVLVGLNYEVSRGLNFGAGGHYGRHKVIIGQPNFEFGKDVYAGGSSFSEANNTRQQWDLAWYVGIGVDLRVIGVFSGRNKDVSALVTPVPTPANSSAIAEAAKKTADAQAAAEDAKAKAVDAQGAAEAAKNKAEAAQKAAEEAKVKAEAAVKPKQAAARK